MTRFQCRRVPACVSFKWSLEIFKQNICSEIVFRDVRSMRLLNVLVTNGKTDEIRPETKFFWREDFASSSSQVQ